MKARHYILICLCLTFASCIRKPGAPQAAGFEIRDFDAISNYNPDRNQEKDEALLWLDYRGSVGGFSIPSANQIEGGQFVMRFSIRNNSDSSRRFWFKIYYQNETYKHPETLPGSSHKMNPRSAENFYGSWEDTRITFLQTPLIPNDGHFHPVEASFRIVGNPRNEKKYCEGENNNRWKRNPRVGEYRFLLVACRNCPSAEDFIPDYISDISQTTAGGDFVNPFWYFLSGGGHSLPEVVTVESRRRLRVKARPDPTAGIYINPTDFPEEKYGMYFTENCNSSEKLYLNAPFCQFLNYVDSSSSFSNIPVKADMLSDDYSLLEYNWNRVFTRSYDRIRTSPETADCPCKNFDTLAGGRLQMTNQAGEQDILQKQSTGIISRNGFTFGRYTVKIKMTELLNRHGIWNGITNAIWLVTHSREAWNYRSPCRKEGYLKQYWGGPGDERVKQTAYSEIDFEILKTAAYCPSYSYPPANYYAVADRRKAGNWNVPVPEGSLADSANIMVCCTNWDMACPEPTGYAVGCHPVVYGNHTFLAHRWDYWYRAVTQKTPAPDDELFGGPFYYFQIDWRPDEIIWRIGPSTEKLRVVGYMNSTMTSIPDNQMLLVISQEFHDTDWWHGSPFAQRDIPFPARDYSGIIYEITVE